MAITRPTIFWIAVLVASIFMLVVLRTVVLPFAVGITLAYLLVPAVDRLERLGMKRAAAAMTLILALVGAAVAIFALLLPTAINEARFFLDEFPRYVMRIQSLVQDTSRPWLQDVLGHELHGGARSPTIETAMGSAWLDDTLRSLWSGGQALISIVSLVVAVPIISIYVLIDWKRMIQTIDGWLPEKRLKAVWTLGLEIHDTVAGFVRGQMLICLILAMLYAAALRAIGLNHAVLIGITAGLISFVPYLGAGIGFVVAMCVAAAQFWPNWTPLVIVASIFLIGETLADYVLSPRIIGSRVKLNPVWLMFALFAFGSLLGIVGLLIAVPLAASMGVVLRFATRQLLSE